MSAATGTVALFATCINDTLFPETPKAVVRLLERLGCRVDFPLQQTCCGQMFTNTGYFKEALPSVRTAATVAAVDRFLSHLHRQYSNRSASAPGR